MNDSRQIDKPTTRTKNVPDEYNINLSARMKTFFDKKKTVHQLTKFNCAPHVGTTM